ncbi:MAG: hypothetical protein AB8I56_15800 [Anaerolineales bacterium]|jgi:NADP-dependent 3-hydroxy acid dehydrogenase YdfG
MENDELSQLFTLQDSVAVLTGGGGVLCAAMGKALAQVGVRVALLDISLQAAQKVTNEIQVCYRYRCPSGWRFLSIQRRITI